MSNRDKLKYIEYRRKRVKRIKAVILFICAIMLFLPSFFCVIMFSRMNKIEKAFITMQKEINVLRQEEVTSKKSYSNEPLEVPDTTYTVVKEDIPDSLKYEGMTRIYLTFDDGPSDNTDRILTILDEYGIKGTFFCCAKENKDEQYQNIVKSGNSIGIHSYSHEYSDVYSSLSSFSNDINKMSDIILEKTGVRTYIYRFPGGSSNNVTSISKNSMFDYLSDNGYTYFDWNVSAQDAVSGGISSEQIVNNICNQIVPGTINVVLMHDCNDKNSTVDALPTVIEKMINRDDVIFLPITENTEPVCHVIKED